jgi:predicted P-loop ATPase
MPTTDSTKSDVNAQYEVCARKFEAITEKFEVSSGGTKQLKSNAAQALIELAASAKDVDEYQQVIRLIARHRPMTDQDYKMVKKALHESGHNPTMATIKSGIEEVTKELNARKKKMKQESSMDVHGIQRSVQWVAMGGKENLTKLDTITNTKALLDAMGITVRHNIMTRTDEYTGGVADGRDQGSAVIRIISAGKSQEYGCRDVGDHLEEIARENEYHPVRDWLKGVEWDGISRLKALGDTLVSDMDDDFKLTLIKRWAVGAIRAALDETPPALQGVLVLSGAQGLGKTTWLQSLCPVPNAV